LCYEANRPVVVSADASGGAVIPAGDVRAVLCAANKVAVENAASVATIKGETRPHWEDLRTDGRVL
jgi:formylmethanofuran dehydrogenase subunit C